MRKLEYFRMDLDFYMVDRWYLGRPVGLSGTLGKHFITPKYIGSDEVFEMPVKKPGPELRFTIGNFGTPVVEESLAFAIQNMCGPDVELINAKIDSKNKYYILNVVSLIDCIDKQKSELSYKKDGSILAMPKLSIMKEAAWPHHMFKVGTDISIIVSGEIRDLICSTGSHMVIFRDV
jgi:hypothetical protein